ncbi:MAG: NAD(P)H-binding protein [Acidimicrobiia bacterium]
MPVIVVGADSPLGAAIVDTLRGRPGELRAFVGTAAAGEPLRAAGFKVAVGDISDSTHVEGAVFGCYTAVLVAEAAADGRELAFAVGPDSVIDGWLAAVTASAVPRVILVGAIRPARAGVEWATVDPSGRTAAEVAAEVAHLDNTRAI